MWDDIMEVLVAFLPIHETTARFVLHQALSRAERGGVPQSETVSVDILPIRTAQMLPIAFVHEARARMVEFAGRHFGEPPD